MKVSHAQLPNITTKPPTITNNANNDPNTRVKALRLAFGKMGSDTRFGGSSSITHSPPSQTALRRETAQK